MKLRAKATKAITGESSRFNMSSLSEIIVGFDEGDMDSSPIGYWEVLLPGGEWKDLRQAFKDRDVVPDNANANFGLPLNAMYKARGYNP